MPEVEPLDAPAAGPIAVEATQLFETVDWLCERVQEQHLAISALQRAVIAGAAEGGAAPGSSRRSSVEESEAQSELWADQRMPRDAVQGALLKLELGEIRAEVSSCLRSKDLEPVRSLTLAKLGQVELQLREEMKQLGAGLRDRMHQQASELRLALERSSANFREQLKLCGVLVDAPESPAPTGTFCTESKTQWAGASETPEVGERPVKEDAARGGAAWRRDRPAEAAALDATAPKAPGPAPGGASLEAVVQELRALRRDHLALVESLGRRGESEPERTPQLHAQGMQEQQSDGRGVRLTPAVGSTSAPFGAQADGLAAGSGRQAQMARPAEAPGQGALVASSAAEARADELSRPSPERVRLGGELILHLSQNTGGDEAELAEYMERQRLIESRLARLEEDLEGGGLESEGVAQGLRVIVKDVRCCLQRCELLLQLPQIRDFVKIFHRSMQASAVLRRRWPAGTEPGPGSPLAYTPEPETALEAPDPGRAGPGGRRPFRSVEGWGRPHTPLRLDPRSRAAPAEARPRPAEAPREGRYLPRAQGGAA